MMQHKILGQELWARAHDVKEIWLIYLHGRDKHHLRQACSWINTSVVEISIQATLLQQLWVTIGVVRSWGPISTGQRKLQETSMPCLHEAWTHHSSCKPVGRHGEASPNTGSWTGTRGCICRGRSTCESTTLTSRFSSTRPPIPASLWPTTRIASSRPPANGSTCLPWTSSQFRCIVQKLQYFSTKIKQPFWLQLHKREMLQRMSF